VIGVAPVRAQRPPVPATPVAPEVTPAAETVAESRDPVVAETVDGPGDDPIGFFVEARFRGDVLALEQFRPGYGFWTHVFSRPDGSVVFGSAETGQLLASFPSGGDWVHEAQWEKDELARVLDDRSMPRRLSDRRDLVAEVLEPVAGPVVHNPTRGNFVTPNARLYGSFLEEWGRIYERFGVPADVGLAQALIESGFSGEVKSEARATGFCQWMPRNWQRLDRLTSNVIEVENQTTQAAYCAAYLTVLATKYGSLLPALSEHHAGSTNVGRTVINGARMGGSDIRERYLMGAEFAKDVRALSPRTFRDVVGTYGPRSYRYAEMVFGNMATVQAIRAQYEQEPIYAMRASRDLSMADIRRATGLTQSEIKRFNPAFVRKVPRSATVYLPIFSATLGTDVAFWQRPAPADYDAVLFDFLRLGVPLEEWESPSFEAVLQDFRARFRATDSEEGRVMDAVLGYVIQEMPLLHRQLAAYRTDPQIDQLFEQGMEMRAATPGLETGR
jgi:hypothetical protein